MELHIISPNSWTRHWAVFSAPRAKPSRLRAPAVRAAVYGARVRALKQGLEVGGWGLGNGEWNARIPPLKQGFGFGVWGLGNGASYYLSELVEALLPDYPLGGFQRSAREALA